MRAIHPATKRLLEKRPHQIKKVAFLKFTLHFSAFHTTFPKKKMMPIKQKSLTCKPLGTPSSKTLQTCWLFVCTAYATYQGLQKIWNFIHIIFDEHFFSCEKHTMLSYGCNCEYGMSFPRKLSQAHLVYYFAILNLYFILIARLHIYLAFLQDPQADITTLWGCWSLRDKSFCSYKGTCASFASFPASDCPLSILKTGKRKLGDPPD